MNYILLSGGSGKRLWPLSNDVRSKQFIPLFRKTDGSYESMLQRVYRQILSADQNANVTIATAQKQVSMIRNQLGNSVGISVEPCRRDTFPAIVLAVSYLHEMQGLDLDETVVVCPVDPFVDDAYFDLLKIMGNIASDEKRLILMGIEPAYPSEKYGYIIPESTENISEVKFFKEKPGKEDAEKYIMQGALWNGGVFAFKTGALLERAHQIMVFQDYQDLFQRYHDFEKISFDYAFVEKERDIRVLRYAGTWKDLGTWNTLTETIGETSIGNVVLGSECVDTHVINELDIPILCMGTNNLVISASPDGILVSDKEQSSYIKPYVDTIVQDVMYAEKSWGSYRVVDIESGSMTIRVMLRSGCSMNYHCHMHRSEVWTVVFGNGQVVLDGISRNCTVGDVIEIPIGCKHTIRACSDMQLIEVQIGDAINVEDKIKFHL